MSAKKNIDQSFIRELQSLWSVEKLLTESMPSMIEKATHPGLKKNLATHFAETDQHKVAIEAICKQLECSHEGEENTEMKDMLAKGEQAIKATTGEAVNAAIITGAIEVEHYEIRKYIAAGDAAERLGYEGVAKRLRLTMEEERQADAKLNFLEKTFIRQSAMLGAPGLDLK